MSIPEIETDSHDANWNGGLIPARARHNLINIMASITITVSQTTTAPDGSSTSTTATIDVPLTAAPAIAAGHGQDAAQDATPVDDHATTPPAPASFPEGCIEYAADGVVLAGDMSPEQVQACIAAGAKSWLCVATPCHGARRGGGALCIVPRPKPGPCAS